MLVLPGGLRPSDDAPLMTEAYAGDLIVFARTADDQWYRVFEDGEDEGWVSAGDVTVISMPEGVPVANP